MNPYQALGVMPGASPDELRRAWRRRALETHPDHGGDDASFTLVHRAYVSLSARTAAQGGPVLVRHMDVTALALRWCRRRRDRNIRPRVV